METMERKCSGLCSTCWVGPTKCANSGSWCWHCLGFIDPQERDNCGVCKTCQKEERQDPERFMKEALEAQKDPEGVAKRIQERRQAIEQPAPTEPEPNPVPEETEPEPEPVHAKSQDGQKSKKTSAEQKYVRGELKRVLKEIKEGKTPIYKTQGALAIALGIATNTISTFMSRRQNLNDVAVEKLYELGVIARFQNSVPKAESIPEGSKTVAEASQEKLVSPATIRALVKNGRLHGVKVGRRIYVLADDRYESVPVSQDSKFALKAKIVQLEKQIADMRQLKFSFMEAKSSFMEEKYDEVSQSVILHAQLS